MGKKLVNFILGDRASLALSEGRFVVVNLRRPSLVIEVLDADSQSYALVRCNP
jgi:hypothetical protein